jgi:hypothetical protein
MLNVRWRTGVVAVASGAAVLLALPVVAGGQVPRVDRVVGGVTQTAGSVVQAPAPAPLPAPAPAPGPAPQASGPAPAAHRTPVPGSHTTATPSASLGSAGSTRTPARRPASASAASDREPARAHSAQQSGEPEDEGDIPPAERTKREPASAGNDSAGAGDNGNGAADDPSQGRLPFTGLQLALIFVVGLAALAGGAVLRRGLRPSRA